MVRPEGPVLAMPHRGTEPLLAAIHVLVGGGEDVRFGHILREHRDPEAGRQRDRLPVIDDGRRIERLAQPRHFRPPPLLARMVPNQPDPVAPAPRPAGAGAAHARPPGGTLP